MLTPPSTYTNPVYAHACPDPFVLKFCGEYWCYFTGIQPDGRAFGILHSPDLVHWRPVGSAMDLLPGEHTCYWAPEVVYANGKFYMYYSVGNETIMHIRVAVATGPAGPFLDSGHELTQEDFAIDAHVFIDDDGQHYLFYATDYLEHSRIGTGTAYDRMIDPFTLAGQAQPVTRARYDWQIFDPQRASKGGVCWHTIEGPFVLKRRGRYYQMFSGGNWQNSTYGVSYAVTDDLKTGQEGDTEWEQVCDGLQELPVLRSLPEQGVIGPGHNSVVRGPDNRELFCVYHRWQPETEERVLAIDRLVWADGPGRERLLVEGPTTGPTRLPNRPALGSFEGVQCPDGSCQVLDNGRRLQLAGEHGRASIPVPASPQTAGFVLEVSLQALPPSTPGAVGVELKNEAGKSLICRLNFGAEAPMLSVEVGGWEYNLALPEAFDPYVFHLLRIESGPDRLRLELDTPAWRLDIPARPNELHQIDFFTHQAVAQLVGLELTLISKG